MPLFHLAMEQTSEVDLENATPAQLLLLAATLGRTDLVMSAISNGADVNAQIPNQNNPAKTLTALHAAVQNRHIDVIRALLSAPADLHVLDSSGQSALSYLPPKSEALDLHAVFASDLCQKAARSDPSAFNNAMTAGLDPTVPDTPELGNTPLHWAASFGATECVRLLIDVAVPLDVVNNAGLTPLADAALGGHSSVVRMLVDAGADPSVTDSRGRPLLDLPLSEQVRIALRPSEPSAQVDPVNTYEDVSDVPPIPPTPSFIPGQNNFSAPHPDLPEWAAALWPPPHRFCEAGGSFTIPPVLTISAENSALPVASLFIQWLIECPPVRKTDTTVRLVGGGQGGLGEPIAFSAAIFLRIDSHAVEGSVQAYSICVRDFGIDVIASDPAGLFYACATLVNLFTVSMIRSNDPATPFTIPTLSISDWPSIRRRGLYLSLSRKCIPTMATLKSLITFMSRQLKFNELHFNVLANFDNLKSVSQEAMFRHEDILELDQWCNNHFVDFIPVISTHSISTISDGDAKANGTSDVSRLQQNENIGDEMLLDEFLPLFDSQQVNFGNAQEGVGAVDFANLRKLLRSLRSRGKRSLHVFGNGLVDILADEKMAPSVLPEFPARTVLIAEADIDRPNWLMNACLLLRRYGLPFYTCASSCLGDGIAGQLSACLLQTTDAVTAATEQGAVGILLKDASICTTFAPLILLYQRLLPFGGAAWNSKRIVRVGTIGPDDILAQLFDTYLFNDPMDSGVLGRIAVSLGDLHLITGDENGKALSQLLSQRDDASSRALYMMTQVGLRRAVRRADRIEQALGSYEGNAKPDDVAELRLTAILMGVASRIGASLWSISPGEATEENGQENGDNSLVPGVHGDISLASLPDGRRSDLCNYLLQAIELMRESWMRRNHKVGFVQAVDEIVGRTLTKLSHGMPYQEFLEERRAEEWISTDN